MLHSPTPSFAILLVLGLTMGSPLFAADDSWQGFRGPQGSSRSEAKLPTSWDVATGENIAWTADLPGRGVSGPIVVGGRVFVTASDGPNRDRLHVIAFDATNGKQLWHRRFWATGRTLCHPTSANAAPTPASDGERIFAFFSSTDLICLDLDGNMQWMRALALDHLGVGNDVGMGASPAVTGNAVVVQCECQVNSFAVAYDRVTGDELWKVDRPGSANWTSPVALDVQVNGKQQPAVVMQSSESITTLSATDGEALWELPLRCAGMSSASGGDGVVYVPAGDQGIVALATSPDFLSTRQLWSTSKLKVGNPSPIVTSKQIFIVNRAGVLASASLTDGSIHWRKRLGGNFWATPVVASGHLYAVNDAGKAFVVDIESGDIVSKNNFGDGEEVLGSPAVSDNALFVRSHRHLWKIAKEKR